LFERAKAYEKPEEGYTWAQRESLEELARPERIEQIRREEEKRKAQAAIRRKPKTLAEIFTHVDENPEDEHACLICHL